MRRRDEAVDAEPIAIQGLPGTFAASARSCFPVAVSSRCAPVQTRSPAGFNRSSRGATSGFHRPISFTPVASAWSRNNSLVPVRPPPSATRPSALTEPTGRWVETSAFQCCVCTPLGASRSTHSAPSGVRNTRSSWPRNFTHASFTEEASSHCGSMRVRSQVFVTSPATTSSPDNGWTRASCGAASAPSTAWSG